MNLALGVGSVQRFSLRGPLQINRAVAHPHMKINGLRVAQGELQPSLRHCQADTKANQTVSVSWVTKTHDEPTPVRRDPRTDDLKDWVAIGMIIVASSLLLWTPLFI